MAFFRSSIAALAMLSLLGRSSAQCLNEVAAFNPNIRTLTANTTWFIVPVNKTAVLTAAQQSYPGQSLTLLDVPSSNTTLFPNGFPDGFQPVLVSIGLQDDIRMSVLQIDGQLRNAAVFATYVSQNGSPAPLGASLNAYIGGPNGPLPAGLVPAIASPLAFGGSPLRLGQFDPQAAPYEGDASGTLSSDAKWAFLPNPLSGPGVYPEVADFIFHAIAESSSKYTDKTFKALINQPEILPSGMCQRNTYYFNNASANPFFGNGQVTFGPAADGIGLTTGSLMAASPGGFGVYQDVDSYSACTQSLGNNIETCDVASANVDPASLN